MLFSSSKCLFSFKRTVLVDLKIFKIHSFTFIYFRKKNPGHREISRIKSLLESVEKLGESLASHQWTPVCVGTPPQPRLLLPYTQQLRLRSSLDVPQQVKG